MRDGKKPMRMWMVYGRFGKARRGNVIQECVVKAKTMRVALRSAILDIMRRRDVQRLRHASAVFTIEEIQRPREYAGQRELRKVV